MKKLFLRIFGLLLVAAAALGGYRFVKQFEQKQPVLPTAPVRRSDVIIRSYTRGELRAIRSASLIAPNLFGTVQVTRLAPLGAFAHEKDLIVEFDDSEVQSRLEEKELELEQLDEQLRKSTAELEIRNNQDQVDLLRSRYDVRRAELEVKRNELLSGIDQKKNLLNLEEARRRLQQLESDIKSRLEQAEAQLAVLRAQKSKSMLELDREKARLQQVKLLAPMDGLVAVRQNRGGMMFYRTGMQIPDIREGDQVFPGMPVADVLDLSELEVAAKVGELDRANLHEGQEVSIRLDAVPDKVFHGKIKALSGTASANIWSGDPAKKFDVTFSIDMKELLKGLGATPQQIQRILETAAKNRNKPPAPGGPPRMMMAGGPAMGGGPMGGGPMGGGPTGMMPGGQGAPSAQGEQGRQGRRGGFARRSGGGSQMSSEQQQKMREAIQKILGGRNPRDLSAEDRQKIGDQIRALMQGSGGSRTQGGGGAQAGGGRMMRAPGAGGAGGPGAMPFVPMSGRQQFTQKDLEEAKLPPPPEASSQLDILLRPGLLADVEIIIEKVPNALHVPVQAVFEREGKPVVYVKAGDKFEPRAIQPLKRSESVLVIASGVKPGELVALADPFARPEKKGSQGGSSRKSAVPGAAGGK